MTDEPGQLCKQAATDPASIDATHVARTLESNPGEADAVGRALLRLAEADEVKTAKAAVADRLDHERDPVRAAAASAFHTYFTEQPVYDEAIVRSLGARLEDEYAVARRHAGAALRAVSHEHPRAVFEAIDQIPTLLDPDNPRVTSIGTDLVEIAVETDAAAAIDLIGPVLKTLREIPSLEAGVIPAEGTGMSSSAPAHDQYESFAGETQQIRARLASIAREILVDQPSAVHGRLDVVKDILESVDAGSVRAPLAEAVGHVAVRDPDGVEPAIESLGSLLADDDPGVVGNAAWALGILGESHGDRVGDVAVTHLSSLQSLLSGTENARIAGVALLSYVCESQSELAPKVVDALVDRLDDDSTQVRTMAALALSHTDAESAISALRSVAKSDPDEEVKTAATEALDRIQSER